MSLTESRLPVARLLLALCALVLLAACRPRGSDLTHEEGLDGHRSAAVANQATAPERDDAPPGSADLASADGALLRTGGPETAGVQHGFADASGGHSLPRTAQADERREGTTAAAGGPKLEQHVRAVIERGDGFELSAEQKAAVNISVEGDRVFLRGRVPNDGIGAALADQIRSLPGVAHVENELESEPAPPAE